MTITFEVLGTPQAQGSIRAFTPKGHDKPILTSDNKKLNPWRQDVGYMAREAMRKAGICGWINEGIPLHVEAHFSFIRPKRAKKTQWHKLTRPDLDKLARALLDAMTGIVYGDDAQVAQLFMTKHLDEYAKTLVRITAMEG